MNQNERMADMQDRIANDMQLLELTGVEDRLHPNVYETLEKPRYA